VIYKFWDGEKSNLTNGAQEAPAMIVRVWSEVRGPTQLPLRGTQSYFGNRCMLRVPAHTLTSPFSHLTRGAEPDI
jgi:hypothetical protein